MTWSDAFAAYLRRSGVSRREAAEAIGVSAATVHYWLNGSEPRVETRRRVEEWSEGEIPAEPWSTPDDDAA